MEETIDSIIVRCLGKLQIPKKSVIEPINVQSVDSIWELIPDSERYSRLKIQTDQNLFPVSQLTMDGDGADDGGGGGGVDGGVDGGGDGVGGGDKIDVVAPASIIMQLGNMPFSKEPRLSIGVQLLEKILVLGPVIEDGEHQPRSSNDDVQPEIPPFSLDQFGYEVLIFLQEYCNEDPGAYWLHVGEDAILLFYFPVIPNQSSNLSPLPSSFYKGRIESLMCFGKLLYRVAHRLSFSRAPKALDKCIEYLRKSLEVLNEPDHLVVRACVEEQIARLIVDGKLDCTEALLHISGAITSLRFSRELQYGDDNPYHQDVSSICACEETCCADVCDVMEWLPTSMIDHKIWKIIFMLGECFLGHAYNGKGQNLLEWKMSAVSLAELKRVGGQDSLGGVLNYLESPINMDDEGFFRSGLICFQSVEKAFGKLPTPLLKKMGECYFRLGMRHRQQEDFVKSEETFSKALDAFKKAMDQANVYVVQSRMAEVSLASGDWSKYLSKSAPRCAMGVDFAINHAKATINSFRLADSEFKKVDNSRKYNVYRNKVCTMWAASYVILAELLIAKADGFTEDREFEQSLMDAIAIYEELGDHVSNAVRFAAYKLFGDYQCHLCLQQPKSIDEKDVRKAKNHFSLAQKYMKKAADCICPQADSLTYLKIHMLQASLYSKVLPYENMEHAFECLLKARHIAHVGDEDRDEFWKQLTSLLKEMCKLKGSQETIGPKLKQLYLKSMKTKDFGELKSMYEIWTSQNT